MNIAYVTTEAQIVNQLGLVMVRRDSQTDYWSEKLNSLENSLPAWRPVAAG